MKSLIAFIVSGRLQTTVCTTSLHQIGQLGELIAAVGNKILMSVLHQGHTAFSLG